MQANTHTNEDLETFAEHYDMTVAQAAAYVGTIGNVANKAF